MGGGFQETLMDRESNAEAVTSLGGAVGTDVGVVPVVIVSSIEHHHHHKHYRKQK